MRLSNFSAGLLISFFIIVRGIAIDHHGTADLVIDGDNLEGHPTALELDADVASDPFDTASDPADVLYLPNDKYPLIPDSPGSFPEMNLNDLATSGCDSGTREIRPSSARWEPYQAQFHFKLRGTPKDPDGKCRWHSHGNAIFVTEPRTVGPWQIACRPGPSGGMTVSIIAIPGAGRLNASHWQDTFIIAACHRNSHNELW